MLYKRLDGTTFDGPLFHPQMEVVGLENGRTYLTQFGEHGEALYRQELEVDENGNFIYPEDEQ